MGNMLNEFQEMVHKRHLEHMKFDEKEVDRVHTIYDTNGNPYPLVKLNTVLNMPDSRVFGGYKTRYIVTDNESNPFAQISIISDEKTALIEYRNEGARRHGIVFAGLLTVENDIFENGVLNNLPTPNGDSAISNLQLDIDSSNRASQHLATKAGFTYDEETEIAIKSLEDHLQQLVEGVEQWKINIL